ncbi:MAG TPA: hypothetical protein VMV69_17805 [Pirellulales bacterium]|nr:hypothetical protein [Pirellulales bacterium]
MSLFRRWSIAAVSLSLAVAPAERIAAQPRSPNPPARRPNQAAAAVPRAAPAHQAAGRQAHGAAHRPTVLRGIPRQRKPRNPFQLTAEQQAVVDLVLRQWEKKQKGITTFSCSFILREYDGTYQDDKSRTRESEGVLYYAAPDKGSYRVYDKKDVPGERWVCDGKAIYEFQSAEKKLIERPLPEEMRGKAIADSPLPFVFGSSAEKMLQRYWMKVSTPADNRTGIMLEEGQILLEAVPRFRQDAGNFQSVEVVLNERDMLPVAINQFLPGHSRQKESRKTYLFSDQVVNGFIDQVSRYISKPRKPLGWKHIVEEPGQPMPDDDPHPLLLDRGARLPAPNKLKAR